MWVAQNLLANSEAEINSRAVNCGFLSPKFLPLHPPSVPEDLLHLESQAFVPGQAGHPASDGPAGRHQGVHPTWLNFNAQVLVWN